MTRGADVVAARLRARGAADEIACAVAPSLAARAVVPIVGALLSTIDARLSAPPRTPALEPPFALVVRRLADGSVALSGAIADLLLETGALDTRAERTVLPSVARARLQGVIAKALSRSPKR